MHDTGDHRAIEITRLSSESGPLTKRIKLDRDGRLVSDGSACVMTRGSAERVSLSGMESLATVIGGVEIAPSHSAWRTAE